MSKLLEIIDCQKLLKKNFVSYYHLDRNNFCGHNILFISKLLELNNRQKLPKFFSRLLNNSISKWKTNELQLKKLAQHNIINTCIKIKIINIDIIQ